MRGFSALIRRVAKAVPGGVTLSPADWEQRHRWISGLLWFHVPVIVGFGLIRGNGALHSIAEAGPVAAMGLLSANRRYGRPLRSVLAGLGLMISSAVLVHLSGGNIEMHFHFFVMLSVISLYQDWRPFLVSIAFVAAHHAVMGTIRPHDVFDHSSAWNSPLKWAAVHAFFVLASCAASVASWRIVEDSHRRSKTALEDRERHFRALIEHSTDVVTVVDAEGNISYDSPSSVQVLGYTNEVRVGSNGLDYVHPDDIPRSAQILDQVVTRGGTVEVEVRIRHADGSYRWVEAALTNLLGEPAVGGVVANFRDITERKALEEQLTHQALHDPLTRLANRALLLDRIEHARESARRRPGSRLALLYIDLDDFKTVNDGLGHEAGDELLRRAAERIALAVRPGDTAARLGGDEFAILLEDIPAPALAYEIGARILETLRDPFDVAGSAVVINASLGIALSTGDDDAAALLRNADLAMYRAKGQGKGRFEIYEVGMHAAVVERMALKADLRRAVAAKEFEPHYQPIIELASGQVTGVEALARWRHPERGVVAPDAFVPLAEETGLIVEIGRHILNQACADAAGWRSQLGASAPQTISINLSGRQIQHPALLDDVTNALNVSGLPASALTLEITESILLEDADAAASTLAALKSLGLRIALDDFGTGYSSLTYLDRFPVDIVKIDKSFIDGLAGAHTAGSPLVTTIVNLGRLLGLGVTAEGIEDPDQVARLRRLGCGQGQGYHFAKPMPAGELVEFLATGTAPAPSADAVEPLICL